MGRQTPDLMAQVHTIARTTIAQYYVNQAVKRGAERQKVQLGSVSFVQRFGGSLNVNLHPVIAKNSALLTKPTTRGVGTEATCAQQRRIAYL